MSATLEPTTGTIESIGTTATLPDAARRYAITIPIKTRYDNWINGEFRAPVKGRYFSNLTPVTGQHLCEVARSSAEDVELALDAAHAAAPAWGRTSPTARAIILNKIADRLEQNLEAIAVIETIDNGKPIRETMAADLPLAIDHSGISRASFAHRKAPWARSMTTRSRTTSMNHRAWSRRSFHGTSRC